MEQSGNDSRSPPGDHMTQVTPGLSYLKHETDKEQGSENSGKKLKVELEQASGTDGRSSKSKGKKSKQTVPPPCSDSGTAAGFSTSRWSHKSSNYNLTPSLLEEVLNEKKMAMMKSPAVMEHLQQLQDELRESESAANLQRQLASRDEQPQQQHEPEQQLSFRQQPLLQSGQQQQPQPKQQQLQHLQHEKQIFHKHDQSQIMQHSVQQQDQRQPDLSACGDVKEEKALPCPASQSNQSLSAEELDSKTRLDIQDLANRTEIWSRESSAFSSVPSSTKYS